MHRTDVHAELTLLPSAVRGATTSSEEVTTNTARGVLIFLDVTAASGTGGLQVRLQGKDPASGKWFNLNPPPAARTAIGQDVYVLYPGASGAGAQSISAPLPRTWRLQVVHGDGSNYTYSAGASVLA